ncbi:amidohydrolase [Saccharopolyspora sp. K220]|uniref:amidohydrolase n=1 Tax=Saccharopolyspora soli TaxID=2926618 RepID=UPI001F565AFD|nr:amidohydrolase [Saccharopolyspora soli]MCI2421655.1 amidohydrolase [Saccharopolyspora soli]
MCQLCGAEARFATVEDSAVSRRVLFAAAAGLALTPAVLGSPAAAEAFPGDGVDLILHNGHIVTRALPGRSAQAVAISGKRILAVGSTNQIMRLGRRGTRTVDLRGRTVVPGLIDSHFHQFNAALDRPNVSLLEARSIAEVVTRIGERVASSASGAWVQARSGWHESLLAEGRLPTRNELDSVSPDNPVFIPRGGHVATVNGRALALAGITRDTPDPVGGVIVRDANGEPTGVLLERARSLAQAVLPPQPSADEQRRLLREQMAEHNALGITSLTEPGLTPEQIEIYTGLWHDGELTTRAHLLWRIASLADVDAAVGAFQPRAGDDLLRFDGLKYLSDGGVEGGFLRDPYQIVPGEQPSPGYHGVQLLPPGGAEELAEMYRRAARHGFQAQTHVVGDAAMDFIVDVLDAVNRDTPLAPLRWVLMHLFLPTGHNMARMREMGLLASVQDHPVLLGANQVRWWGKERAARAIPIREILDAGLIAGGGTDAPVVPPNPLWSLGWMVTRETLRGDVLGPEQGITPREALHLYTLGSARTQFAERDLGTIESGKLADLVVLDADPLTVEPRSIRDIGVDMTIVGGRVVHERA